MRPWLVLAGASFLAVAVVTGVAPLLAPAPPTDHDISTEIPSLDTGPGQSRAAFLYGSNTSAGTFELTWQATGPIQASVFDTLTCGEPKPSCAGGSPDAIWPSNSSGRFLDSGRLVYPYLLVWTNHASSSVSFLARALAHTSSRSPTPLFTTLVVDLAASILGVLGLLAVFLGLFLRRGVYRGGAPLISRSADDVEAIAGGRGPPVIDPRTGSSAGGSGPPPPRAPFRDP